MYCSSSCIISLFRTRCFQVLHIQLLEVADYSCYNVVIIFNTDECFKWHRLRMETQTLLPYFGSQPPDILTNLTENTHTKCLKDSQKLKDEADLYHPAFPEIQTGLSSHKTEKVTARRTPVRRSNPVAGGLLLFGPCAHDGFTCSCNVTYTVLSKITVY